MARGIDGTDIFRDDEDRTTFLALFEKYSAIAGIRCYAWALMDNHYRKTSGNRTACGIGDVGRTSGTVAKYPFSGS